MVKKLYLTGQTRGWLKILDRDWSRPLYYHCLCTRCGRSKSVGARALQTETVFSCGCYRGAASRARLVGKHIEEPPPSTYISDPEPPSAKSYGVTMGTPITAPDGSIMTVSDIVKTFYPELNGRIVWKRISYGWPLEKLFIPRQMNGNSRKRPGKRKVHIKNKKLKHPHEDLWLPLYMQAERFPHLTVHMLISRVNAGWTDKLFWINKRTPDPLTVKAMEEEEADRPRQEGNIRVLNGALIAERARAYMRNINAAKTLIESAKRNAASRVLSETDS